jgi:hypothetical protein
MVAPHFAKEALPKGVRAAQDLPTAGTIEFTKLKGRIAVEYDGVSSQDAYTCTVGLMPSFGFIKDG